MSLNFGLFTFPVIPSNKLPITHYKKRFYLYLRLPLNLPMYTLPLLPGFMWVTLDQFWIHSIFSSSRYLFFRPLFFFFSQMRSLNFFWLIFQSLHIFFSWTSWRAFCVSFMLLVNDCFVVNEYEVDWTSSSIVVPFSVSMGLMKSTFFFIKYILARFSTFVLL